MERRSPEGAVPLAPNLSVTFSRPMVPVTTHEAPATEAVPISVSPLPAGSWRWLGTRTLVFQPEGRFPMATLYEVRADALEEKWTFQTPPPRLEDHYPFAEGVVESDSILFARFDQRIDPDAVLRTIRVTAEGKIFGLRLAREDEIESESDLSRLVARADRGRFLAFRTVEALPAASRVEVAIGPGTPSAEGPLRTEDVQQFWFRTHGPLTFQEVTCWTNPCAPGGPFRFHFSNPLDHEADETWIRFDPPLPRLEISVHGNQLWVSGATRARATYQVTLASHVRDRFGRTLGKDVLVPLEVGSSAPWLIVRGGEFSVLDPEARSTFTIESMNVPEIRVRAFRVSPADWGTFRSIAREQPPGLSRVYPWPLAFVENVRPRLGLDQLVSTHIDLTAGLDRGRGHLVLDFEPVPPMGPSFRFWGGPIWIQATSIGLSVFEDSSHVRVWATSLRDGTPLDGVEIETEPQGPAATTDRGGLAVLSPRGAVSRVVARSGEDSAFFDADLFPWKRTRRPTGSEDLLWYVVDDRGLYRPGEVVNVKGWLRRVEGANGGDLALPGEHLSGVTYRVTDGTKEIASGAERLNELGGFHTSFAIPADADLGFADIELIAGKQEHHRHSIQIQEFRRPEFEVSIQKDSGPFFVSDAIAIETRAAYYAGGGLPGAAIDYAVFAYPARYTPPNRSDFTFQGYGFERDLPTASHETRTDGSGAHWLGLELEGASFPMTVSVRAGITDLNRQSWNAKTELLVHAADRYVGLRTKRSFVERGVPLRVEALVTDIDGTALGGEPVRLEAFRTRWVYRGKWLQEDTDRQSCEITSGVSPVACSFETPVGGRYRVRARVEDDRRRSNESEIAVWVSGGDLPPNRGLPKEEVTLIADRESYRPGEIAEVLLVAPFAPAEALISVRRSGIVRTEVLHLDGPTESFALPIEEGFAPNVHVQVDLAGRTERTDDAGQVLSRLPKRPARASGAIDLKVPPRDRTLALSVTPRESVLAPGAETVIDVALADARGVPVARAEVLVAVVDEAVLALSRYRFQDPMEVFYPPRDSGVADFHLRDRVLLASDSALPSIFGGVNVANSALSSLETVRPPAAPPPPPQSPLRPRSDFRALALFAPSVRTDERGRAAVPLTLPDSLTRYRVMAVGTDGARRFGSSEAALTVRLPLMVRPSPPRFLNYGDRFELPVLLQNQTDEPLEVKVAVEARNARLLDSGARRAAVPAFDRVEVRFPAAAANGGSATFQAIATSGSLEDASLFSLPVWTPATTEAFATYGEIDRGGVSQPVRRPESVAPEFGGLEIGMSSTALQSLTDAFLYLNDYPFQCAEQIASRLLAIVALKDVLAAFGGAGLPEATTLETRIKQDFDSLTRLQNADGGFAFWRRGDESWPFLSIHAAHSFVRAREKGIAVPDDLWRLSREYLVDIEEKIPDDYGAEERRSLIAYATYVLGRAGELDSKRARAVIEDAGGIEGVPLEALGWLLPVLAAHADSAGLVVEVRRHLNNRVTETAGAAHFVTSYEDGAHVLLSSDRRADGVLLEALIGVAPESDLIPKLAAGLLAHRTAGRWSGTQENVFAVLALERYFRTFENEAPDFVARTWLGDGLAGERAFRGRTTERHRIEIPMSALMNFGEETPFVLSKEGQGRLYYRIGLTYAPSDLSLDPLERGFTVERRYEAVDATEDVTRLGDGTWRVRAGALVRVVLTFVAPSRRYHVALVDPLAAGLEPLNPALAIAAPPDVLDRALDPRVWWLRRQWFDHQNLRDERAEAFTSLLWEGVHEYAYFARATTPGDFVVPPTRVEEMYSPETFGRSATDRVRIE